MTTQANHLYTATKLAITAAIVAFRGPGLDAYALADMIRNHLRFLAPKARTRHLSFGEILCITAEHAGNLEKMAPGKYLYTRADGGAVSNSYRSGADTDRIEIFSARTESGAWYTEVRVARTWADKIPWGREPLHANQAGPLDSKKGGAIAATCRALVPQGPADDVAVAS